MLKKLLKHEWAETWKIPSLTLVTIFLLSAVCALYFHLAPAAAPNVAINVGNLTLFILCIFFDGMISLLITIYLGIRFYKNLYTDQGYLMHTLPVRPRMLIASKAVIGAFWIYIASLASTLFILPVTVLALPKIGYMDPAELAEVIPALMTTFGGSGFGAAFYFLPYTLVSSIFSVLLLYSSISLGQLFGKHKGISSIICYLGLSALYSAINAFFMVPGMTGIIVTHADETDAFMSLVIPSIMRNAYFVSFAVSVVLSVLSFWLCNHLMSKSLNLD